MTQTSAFEDLRPILLQYFPVLNSFCSCTVLVDEQWKLLGANTYKHLKVLTKPNRVPLLNLSTDIFCPKYSRWQPGVRYRASKVSCNLWDVV